MKHHARTAVALCATVSALGLTACAPASWVQAEQNNVTANVIPSGLSNFPAWVNQGHGVYVMSPEPVVEVYNPKLLAAAQVPRTYAQLAADTASNPAKYKLVSYPIHDPLNYAAIYGRIHLLGWAHLWHHYSPLQPPPPTLTNPTPRS